MRNRDWLMLFAAAACLGLLYAADTPPQAPVEPIFAPVKVDGPVHDPAKSTFWYGPFSECASVADFNGDGRLDIAAGRNLYLAPNWTKVADFRDGAETNGPETDDNSEFAMDVNMDGRPDIVSSGWMRMKAVYWYENPGKPNVKWRAFRIHAAQSLEGVIHGNIAGRGDHDILVNHWSLVPGQGMTWLEHLDKEPWFREHVLGPEGEGHGNGLGDVNGDGLNDPIIGASHQYGLAWLEQTMSGGKRTFAHRWVETDFGGFHTMALGDLDGDGRLELVTGKRLFPHHGRDIGEFDPLFMFWYKINPGGRWERHVLSYNHLPWYPATNTGNPPPNYAIGAGMKLNIADMDGDGRQDVIAAGKSGLYIFYNKGVPPKTRAPNLLPDEKTYPSWIPWDTPRPAAK